MRDKKFQKYLETAKALNHPFRADELPGTNEFLEDKLEESGLFFWTYDNWGSRQYISKKFFFEGAEFSIHLTSSEIQGRYLCGVARFLPFINGLPGMEIDGHEICLEERAINQKCLKSIYNLDNGYALLNSLQANSERDLTSLSSLSNYPLAIYNLKNLEVRAGDHIHFQYVGNRLCGKIIHSEDINLKQIRSWCEQMEKALLGVLDEFGPVTDMETQLERAYFYGPSSLRQGEFLALRDFLKLSSTLSIVDFVFRRIIWHNGENPAESRQLTVEVDKVIEDLSCPKVNAAFYSMLPTELKGDFQLDGDLHREVFEESEISKMVRKTSLWLVNNHNLLRAKDVPTEELLMFYASFSELQRICDLSLNGSGDCKDELHLAFKMNAEILNDLMHYIQVLLLAP